MQDMVQQKNGGVMINVSAIKADLSKFKTIPTYKSASPTAYIPGFDTVKELYGESICFVLDNDGVWLQGERYKMQYRSFLADNVIYVPAEYLCAALGIDFSRDEAAHTVSIGEVKAYENGSRLTVQGRAVDMRAPVKLVEGVIYVPVKEIVSDIMGKYFFQSFKGILFISDNDLGLADTNDIAVDNKVKLMNYIVFDRPNAECVIKALKERFPDMRHPRVFATAEDFARMKALAETDENMKKWSDAVISAADADMEKGVLPVPHYDEANLRLQGLVGPDAVLNLYWAYCMTGSQKYVDRAEAIGLAMAAYPDWNAYRHFLETSDATAGSGMIIDLFYDKLSKGTKDKIAKAMIEFGIRPANEHYYGRGKSDWPLRTNNWNIVCNAGVTTGTLAIIDEYETDLCADTVEKALFSAEQMVHTFAPSGGWFEGVGYWNYTNSNIVMMCHVLESVLGMDFGLSSPPGFMKTGYYPVYASGNEAIFSYHDALRNETVNSQELWWFSRRNKDGNLSKIRLNMMEQYGYKGEIRDMLWYYTENMPDDITLDLDRYFPYAEVASMRSDWDRNCVFAGIHAGLNGVPHGHYDMGTFEYEAYGRKYASDMGCDSYNLPDYFLPGNVANARYYVIRTEGHNLYVINPSADAGQPWTARSEINVAASKPKGAIYKIDLTPGYSKDVHSALRGFKLSGSERKIFTLQDELSSRRKGNEVHWFWHTNADIGFDDAGKTATLDIEGKKVDIYFDSNVDFKLISRKSLPMEISPQDSAQLNNLTNTMNLLEAVFDTTEEVVTFRVTAVPQGVAYTHLSDLTPIADWRIEDGERDTRFDYPNEVRVDGVPVENFESSIEDYTVPLVKPDQVPVVEVTSEGEVDITQATKEDMTATVTVKSHYNPENVVVYHLTFKLFAKYGTPPEGTELKPVNISVSDTPQPENPKEHLYDNDFGTRWSATDTPWATYDLGSAKTINAVALSIYLGNARQQNFGIEISDDGINFTELFRAITKGNTSDYEYIDFEPVKARYVRLQCWGITTLGNNWNSITEFRVYGK